MPKIKSKAFYKDPILLIILFSMVASTFISFFLVNQNNQKIDMLELEIRDNKMIVRELTDNVNQQYSQVSVLVLLDFVANANDKKAELVRNKYLQTLPGLTAKSSAVEILSEFDKYREVEFERINDIYIDQIYLERDKHRLGQKNKLYSNLATLLQIIGLIFLIIRKDFAIF